MISRIKHAYRPGLKLYFSGRRQSIRRLASSESRIPSLREQLINRAQGVSKRLQTKIHEIQSPLASLGENAGKKIEKALYDFPLIRNNQVLSDFFGKFPSEIALDGLDKHPDLERKWIERCIQFFLRVEPETAAFHTRRSGYGGFEDVWEVNLLEDSIGRFDEGELTIEWDQWRQEIKGKVSPFNEQIKKLAALIQRCQSKKPSEELLAETNHEITKGEKLLEG